MIIHYSDRFLIVITSFIVNDFIERIVNSNSNTTRIPTCSQNWTS